MTVRSVFKLSPSALSEIELYLGGYIDNKIVEKEEFQREFEKSFPYEKNIDSSGSRFKVLNIENGNGDIKSAVDEAPIVKLVDELISRAIALGASDIHLEPREGRVCLRYRLDGVLQEQEPLSPDKRLPVISRIKVMADLDIAEKRRPQDGRIMVEAAGKQIDLRVSIIPTNFGEKAAIRILDKTQLNLDIENIGMPENQLEQFRSALNQPNGIILVTGPTGSGKTTTLYAALNYIKNPNINIMTIEDPIEYNLDGVNQSQVKREIGYDFASALRTYLRQDPDVIFVGEIRDLETAEIAIRASLTGHLVLSTLHTNDALSAITRLVDIGIKPFLVASSLKLVIAQRLVRVLCQYCKIQHTPSEAEILLLDQESIRRAIIFKEKGCPKCGGTGYMGRTGVFELMPITADIGEKIHEGASSPEIRKVVSDSILSLRDLASKKVIKGITSLSEISREIS